MKAAVIDGYGGVDGFEIREVEKPSPGPGQLLVRVRAASVNPVDWKLRKGQLRLVKPARFPLILGYDVAGEVEAVGAEVTRFEPGDPVYALVDSAHGGGYAEFVLAGEEAVAPKPERLSFEEAAAVPVAALTALQALRDKAELAQSERLLVNGAAGGVGHFAVQIGKAIGARVIGVASGRNQEFLRELGADRGIDYEEEDFTSDEEDYHVVFDTVGKASFKEWDLILVEGGAYVAAVVDPAIFIRAAICVISSLYGPARRARSIIVEPSGQDLAFLGRLVDAGKLRPHVEEVFRLDRIADAHSYSESGRVRGKLVVRVE